MFEMVPPAHHLDEVFFFISLFLGHSELWASNFCFKNYPELNLNFPPITVNNTFKFQAQDSFLVYFYFGDLDI